MTQILKLIIIKKDITKSNNNYKNQLMMLKYLRYLMTK